GVLETGDHYRYGERIEPRVQENGALLERREHHPVLRRGLFDRGENHALHGSGRPRWERAGHQLLTTIVSISFRSSSTPSNSSSGRWRESAISDSRARKSSSVWVTSHTPCTS